MNTSLSHYRRFMPLIVLLVLFSGIGLLVWFGILPFHRYIIEKADGIQEHYATKENRERQISKLPDLQEQFQSIVAQEQTLNILLSENRIVDVVKTFEALAQETGTDISIQAKSKDAIEEKKGTSSKKSANAEGDEAVSKKKAPETILDTLPYDRYLHVSIIVKGEYQNIVSFLYKMETLPLGLDVIGLSIRKRDEEEAQSRPDNPGKNPFLILAQGPTAPGEVLPVEEVKDQVIPGSLEATFDTVIYVSK